MRYLSPLPGIFYRRPAPEKPPYKAGRRSRRRRRRHRPGRGDEAIHRSQRRRQRQSRALSRRQRGGGRSRSMPCCSSRPPEPRVFDKLLVANRGEIAVRVIRAAKELGLRTVAVFSEADKDSLAVRFADEAVRIGPPRRPRATSMATRSLPRGAKPAPARSIPVTDFCPRTRGLPHAVAAAGLVFVGPSAETIRVMGDKAAARAAAQAAGVPIVPGSEGEVADLAQALAAARTIGFPVMLKASAGGGGRGIRVADDEAGLDATFSDCASRGHGGVRQRRALSRAFPQARAPHRGAGAGRRRTRRCTASSANARCSGGGRKSGRRRRRRRSTTTTRQALCASAVRLAERVHYRGAGTLEYLYDDEPANSSSSK